MAPSSMGWLGKVDPLLKIVGLTLYLSAVLLYKSVPPLAVLTLGAVALLFSSQVGKYPRLLALSFSGIASISAVHWLLGGTPEAIAATAMRLFIFIAMSAALMLSTDPAHLLRSLRRLPIPAGILLGLSVMWRSLPVLKRELLAILHACRLEGVRVGLTRPRAMFRYVLIPLAFGMTGFADDLTQSMHSRGITLSGRHLRPRVSLCWADAFFVTLLAATLAVAVWSIP